MKRVIGIVIFIVAWMCSASECAMDYEYPLYFRNDSEQNVEVVIGHSIYPDTVLPDHLFWNIGGGLFFAPWRKRSF